MVLFPKFPMFALSTPLRKRPSIVLKKWYLSFIFKALQLPYKVSDSLADKVSLVVLVHTILDLILALLHKVAQVIGDGLEAVTLSVHCLALPGTQQA